MKNAKKSNNNLIEKLKGDPTKPIYKKWYFWAGIALIVLIIGGACGTSDETELSSPTTSEEPAKTEEKSNKWSEMTLGDKKFAAEKSCQDMAIQLVDTNKIDIISIRYLWDSWTTMFQDWSKESKEVKDAYKMSETETGLPIYNYRWAGNYKGDSGKEKVVFDCWFSVDEAAEEQLNVLRMRLDDIELYGDKSSVNLSE